MKTGLCTLLIAVSAATLPLAQAQTRPTRKPAPAPAPTTRKPIAKPGAVGAVVRPAAPQPGAARATSAALSAAPQPDPVATSSLLPPPPKTAAAAVSTGGAFDVGTTALNLGIGLGNRYGYGSGFLGGSSSVSPALSLSVERGILPLGPGVLGVGAFVGYQGARYDLGNGDEWKFTDLIVTLRGAFHYPVSPQLDAYGGLGLGLRHAGVSFTGNSNFDYGVASATELASGLFVGGRYFFSDKIGAFAELGYDQTYLKVGLTAKF